MAQYILIAMSVNGNLKVNVFYSLNKIVENTLQNYSQGKINAFRKIENEKLILINEHG